MAEGITGENTPTIEQLLDMMDAVEQHGLFSYSIIELKEGYTNYPLKNGEYKERCIANIMYNRYDLEWNGEEWI